ATAPSTISTLALHDALPISEQTRPQPVVSLARAGHRHRRRIDEAGVQDETPAVVRDQPADRQAVAEGGDGEVRLFGAVEIGPAQDRKSTRLNSSHVKTSYAV